MSLEVSFVIFISSSPSEQIIKHTSPGWTVPTNGEIVIGAFGGTTNSNDVGPTGKMGPLPILGTGWVNSLELKWELITKTCEDEESFTAVA